jgi:hypothetical protein
LSSTAEQLRDLVARFRLAEATPVVSHGTSTKITPIRRAA